MSVDEAGFCPRELCARCLRARAVCFCAEIRPFAAPIRFVILSHPKERRKRIGTGRMAHLCLSNSLLFEGVDFSDDERVSALLEPDGCTFPMLLFPGTPACPARPAERLRAELPPGLVPLVFVLDATWSCARTMERLNSRIRALPRLSFSTTRRSAYRFRCQPFETALSTIEAIHGVLEAFEGGGGAVVPHANLIEVFEWMVARQCGFCEPGTARAVRGVRARSSDQPQRLAMPRASE